MEQDDLPPQQRRSREDGVGWEIGDLFGRMIWLILFAVVVGGIFYLAMRATH